MTKIQLTTGDILEVQECVDEIKSQMFLQPLIEVVEMTRTNTGRLKSSTKTTYLNPMYIVWFE